MALQNFLTLWQYFLYLFTIITQSLHPYWQYLQALFTLPQEGLFLLPLNWPWWLCLALGFFSLCFSEILLFTTNSAIGTDCSFIVHPLLCFFTFIYGLLLGYFSWRVESWRLEAISLAIPRKWRVILDTALITLCIYVSAFATDLWSLAIVFGVTVHLLFVYNLVVVVDSVGLYDCLSSAFASGVFTVTDKIFVKSVALLISAPFTLVLMSLKHINEANRERLRQAETDEARRAGADDAIQEFFNTLAGAVDEPVMNALEGTANTREAADNAEPTAKGVVDSAEDTVEWAEKVQTAFAAGDEVELAEAVRNVVPAANETLRLARESLDAATTTKNAAQASDELSKKAAATSQLQSDKSLRERLRFQIEGTPVPVRRRH